MNADAVTQFAVAQARLFGRRIGGASTGGTVEIMGQALPADRAHDVIAALNLKLVYLITNPNAPATASNGTLQQFANMDSNGRMQMMQQMQQQMVQQAAEFKGMIEQMTPAERDQFEQMMSSNGLRIKIRTDAGPGP
jgi:hypothetical protein